MSTAAGPRRFVVGAVVAGAIGLVCAPVMTARAAKDRAPANSCPPAFMKRAQQAVDRYRTSSRTPGVAVSFYDAGGSCFFVSGDEGRSQPSPVKPSTAFAMGSVEKVFNSTLLALDLVRGRATIDDPAARYLTADHGARVKRGAPFQKITLKELVTHTSALPREPPHSHERIGMELYRDQPMPASVVQFLDGWRPAYAPGTKYKYSNLGFVVAGTVAVELAHEPYTKLLSDALTGPLGMSRTGVICGSHGPGCAVAHGANGRPSSRMPVGLWTTADDMLRFIEANLGALPLRPALSRAVTLTHQELFRVNADHAVGMGWEERHHGDALLISKDGLDSDFSSWVGFEPNRHRGVAVLRNGGGKPGPEELGQRLLDLAGTHGDSQ